jgi:membrane protein DedA with SNARE-associated domain/rhodanese-related sulfurtransferase
MNSIFGRAICVRFAIKAFLILLGVVRFDERDGGLYIEVEAIALSRDIPAAVRLVADPIVRPSANRSSGSFRRGAKQRMNPSAQFLLHHGYAILFLAVLAEQIGLPLPSSLLLLAAGALAGLHRMNPLAALSLAISASLIGDSVWYCLGRERGGAILGHVCRVSLEPETCVSRTHSLYFRYGAKSLLFCKFVPRLGTLGPPMAGMMQLPPWRFLLLDAGGALVWSGTFVAIGWMFRIQLEILGAAMARLGARFAIVLAAALVVYVAFKYIERRRLYRTLRIARISPFELRHRLDAQEKLIVIDLRNPIEWREGRIPGSLQFEEAELDLTISAKADAETILYCSCPNEASSARAALRLKRRGVRRVRPLEGGFEHWRKLGFPVEH